MIRRFGEAVEPGRRYRPRPGIYALLPRDGALLVTFQDAPRPEFQLPGGGVERGEQPLAALHREVMEETGWRIAPMKRLGAFRRFAYMPDYGLWAEKLCQVVLARPIHRLGPPSEPGHSAVWLPAREAVARLGKRGDAHFVARYLRYGAP